MRTGGGNEPRRIRMLLAQCINQALRPGGLDRQARLAVQRRLLCSAFTGIFHANRQRTQREQRVAQFIGNTRVGTQYEGHPSQEITRSRVSAARAFARDNGCWCRP